MVQDVSRCDRGLHYFSDPGHLDTLRNIVTTYVWDHLDTGYMQVLTTTTMASGIWSKGYRILADDKIDTDKSGSNCLKRLPAGN